VSLGELCERAAYNVAAVDIVYWLISVACAAFLARRPLSRLERLAIGLFRSKR